MTPQIVSLDVPITTRGHQSLRPMNGSQPIEMASDALLQSDDKVAFSMVWECSPGAFAWDYSLDEHALILEGHATLRYGGEARELKAGDIVLFKAGSTVQWVIHQRIRKVAWLRKTGLRAIASKAKYWVKSLLATAPALCFIQIAEPLAPLLA